MVSSISPGTKASLKLVRVPTRCPRCARPGLQILPAAPALGGRSRSAVSSGIQAARGQDPHTPWGDPWPSSGSPWALLELGRMGPTMMGSEAWVLPDCSPTG